MGTLPNPWPSTWSEVILYFQKNYQEKITGWNVVTTILVITTILYAAIRVLQFHRNPNFLAKYTTDTSRTRSFWKSLTSFLLVAKLLSPEPHSGPWYSAKSLICPVTWAAAEPSPNPLAVFQSSSKVSLHSTPNEEESTRLESGPSTRLALALSSILPLSRHGEPAPYPIPGLPTVHSSTDNPDLELLDLVLVSTIDGSLHAVERSTGRLIWTQMGAVLNETDRTLVSSRSRFMPSGSNSTEIVRQTEPLYIVEPYDGRLYVYLPPQDPLDITGNPTWATGEFDGRLQKLPLTMEELIDNSPFTFPHQTSHVFIGSKTSSLMAIDLQTGDKVSSYLTDTACDWDSSDDDAWAQGECESDIDARPEDKLFIGRIEYTLTVHSNRYGGPIQQLRHVRLVPNAIHRDLAEYWRRTGKLKGEVYIKNREARRYQGAWKPTVYENRWRVEMMHDGTIVGFEQDRGMSWHLGLGSLAVSVFDVLLPTAPGSQPILLPQPPAQIPNLFPSTEAQLEVASLPPSTYLAPANMVDTSWNQSSLAEGVFAMSSENYPLVNFAPRAKKNDLVGSHVIVEAIKERMPYLLDPPAEDTDPVPTSYGVHARWKRVRSNSAVVSASLLAAALLAILWKVFWRKPAVVTIVPTATPVPAPIDLSPSLVPIEPSPLSALVEPGSLPFAEKPLPAVPDAELDAEPTIRQDIKLDHAPTEDLASTVVNVENGHLKPEIGLIDEIGKDASKLEDEKKGRRKTNGRRRKRGKKNKKGDSGDNSDSDTAKENEEEEGTKANLIVEPDHVMAKISDLIVSDEVLGLGSQGTVVYKGVFQGRAVAVKRLLRDFVTVAHQEVTLLQASDDHQNVVRYYYQEQRDNFLYIALELCPASLADVIERPDSHQELAVDFNPKKALFQLTDGLRHLHALKIIHRDLKPQNVLISVGRNGAQRMLLSDFGLAKRLDHGVSSYAQTGNNAVGSVGWRAPECLRGEVHLDEVPDSDSDPASQSGSKGLLTNGSDNAGNGKSRLTKAVDLFALGCLYFYVLTNGSHPFGDRFEREVNIVRSDIVSLDKLLAYGEDGFEAKHLVKRLLSPVPDERPETLFCLIHPLFWTTGRRLNFLCDASDRFEIMQLDPPEPTLQLLESRAPSVIGGPSWTKKMDNAFLENLGKHRKYQGGSLRDLLRALRNKKNHYQDLPNHVKSRLGPLPSGFLNYFSSRFPTLFIEVHDLVSESKLRTEQMFHGYFELIES